MVVAKRKTVNKVSQVPASVGEETLWAHLRVYKLESLFVREHRFSDTRGWRFDFACLSAKIAVEVEGGTSSGRSRHSRGVGFSNDCVKYNTAAREGWEVYRFTTKMVKSAEAIDFIRSLLIERGVT